jgi:HEAT repeat protein
MARIDKEPAIPEDELIELMSEIVRNDSDSKVRAAALESIGRLGSQAASEALADLYDSIPELALKKKALSSMSYSRKFTPKVRAKLIDIAKTSEHDELRKAALRALAGIPEDDGADALISVFDSAEQTEIKKTVIRYLSFNRSEAAINKLKTIARQDSDAGLRLEAVQSLGQLHGGVLFATPRSEKLFVDERPVFVAPVPERPPKPPKKKN